MRGYTATMQPTRWPRLGALIKNAGIVAVVALSLLVLVFASRAGVQGIRNRMAPVAALSPAATSYVLPAGAVDPQRVWRTYADATQWTVVAWSDNAITRYPTQYDADSAQAALDWKATVVPPLSNAWWRGQ